MLCETRGLDYMENLIMHCRAFKKSIERFFVSKVKKFEHATMTPENEIQLKQQFRFGNS